MHVRGKIIHSERKRFISVRYAEMPKIDETVNYSLGDFSENGVKNSYFAYTYVYT